MSREADASVVAGDRGAGEPVCWDREHWDQSKLKLAVVLQALAQARWPSAPHAPIEVGCGGLRT